MASMHSHKPADETYQQNPSVGQKVAQMIGLAPKPSHHGQTGHSDHQGKTHANRHGHDASGHGKTEKKMKGKSEHKKGKSLTKKSKGRDGTSGSSSDSSSDSD